MATLWQIDEEILSCFDMETGEIIDPERLEQLTFDKERKLENLCKYVKNLEADIEAYKQYKLDFAAKQKTAENTLNSVKRYIQAYLNGEKWESADKSVSVRYRTTKNKVIVDDVSAIPEEYFKFEKKESNLNKTAIKDSILETGEIIDGVHLEDSVSMSIK